MILIAVLITLALDRMLLWHRDSGLAGLFGFLIDFASTRLPERWTGVGGALAMLLPPVILVGLLQWLIAGWLFGLFSLVFSVAVLLFALGPLDIVNAVDDYLDARRADDSERSDYYYERIVGEKPAPGDGSSEGRRMVEVVLYQGHDHLFAVLFWFCILGPLGAVLYRMSAEAALRPPPGLAARPALGRAARHVAGVLGWAPARLLAFGYAMTGSFEAALRRFREGAPSGEDLLAANQDLLTATGSAALRTTEDDEEAVGQRRSDDAATVVEAARALVLRAGIFWLAVLALLTLAGWLG